MGNLNLEVGFIVFILALVYVCECSPPCETPEIPTSIDDYLENISAHHKNEIQIVEDQLAATEMAFNKQLAIITYNQELGAKTTRQLESRMRSLAAFNMKGKLCMTHFMGNVTGESLNLQNKLRACVTVAQTNSRTFPDGARNQIKNSRAQLHELMNTDLALCHKNNGNNIQKLTECGKEKLRVREINVQNMMKACKQEVENCMCRMDIISRTAQECNYLATLDTLAMLSDIVSNINTCMGDRLLEIK